jgi:threonylcarbamoyladenosine tRNA methylthiotransferase MtaB
MYICAKISVNSEKYPPKKVCFHTLGCKLNFSETSEIARSFKSIGYQRVDFEESPDVYVINTCSVTENADKKCKSLVNKALRVSPNAFIAIIGCYAQLKPNEIARINGVDLVLGANEKFNLPNFLTQIEKKKQAEVHACAINEVKTFRPSYSGEDRTRVFFKIQDGCDYSCSFCTIPLARGASRSATISETIAQARRLIAEKNVSELVLTGVNTGDFGRKNGESFLSLLKELDQLDHINRIRISSIEPNLLSDDIIAFCSTSQKFVPHFHIPLQSGSNKILGAMRRRYRKELYTQRVNVILDKMPDAAIGVDVIVGFPGESEDDFLDTYNFLNELPVAYLHVFTYSERDHTDAAEMTDAVPMSLRNKRSEMLRILSEKKRHAFYERFVNTERKVLWEVEKDGDFMYGFTDNYIKVQTPWSESLINKVVICRLSKSENNGLLMASLPVSDLIS